MAEDGASVTPPEGSVPRRDDLDLRMRRAPLALVAAGLLVLGVFVALLVTEDREAARCTNVEARRQCIERATEAADSHLPWVVPFVGGALLAGGVAMMLPWRRWGRGARGRRLRQRWSTGS